MKRLNKLIDQVNPTRLRNIIILSLAGAGALLILLYILAPSSNGSAVVLNCGTELLGGAVIYILFSVIVERQLRQEAEQRSIDQEKERLILQMGVDDNGFAVIATRMLRKRQWGLWNDKTLQEADLRGADLRGAKLVFFNLAGAKLQGAKLQDVWLSNANLSRADLERADLQRADLSFSNLRGANLKMANLEGVHLLATVFDSGTRLPDESYWTPDTDMKRFTDPEHPDFWHSDHPALSTYPGDHDDNNDDDN